MRLLTGAGVKPQPVSSKQQQITQNNKKMATSPRRKKGPDSMKIFAFNRQAVKALLAGRQYIQVTKPA